MKPRAGNQRGIIFTLSVLLLALAVVGLAQTINEKTKDAADNISYANAAHAVANRFDNSREDLRKLVDQFKKVSPVVEADRITVSDSLPNADYQNPSNRFPLPLEDYKAFVSKYVDNFTFLLNAVEGFNNFQVMLDPYDVLYTHGMRGSDEVISVKPATTSFGYYKVEVNLNGRSYKQVIDEQTSASVAGTGINLQVVVTEGSEGKFDYTFQNLDPAQTSTIHVYSDLGTQTGETLISLEQDGELVVINRTPTTLNYKVSTVFGERESPKELEAPVTELMVQNELFKIKKTSKGFNINDLATIKLQTMNETWDTEKKNFAEREAVNYKAELYNFKGQLIDVSNLQFEFFEPDGGLDTSLTGLTTTNGVYKGSFAKSGGSMEEGTWTLKATATKGSTVSATTTFSVEEFAASCVVQLLDESCSGEDEDGLYGLGEKACFAAQLVDAEDQPIDSSNSISNPTVKALDARNEKETLFAAWNASLKRFESVWTIPLNYSKSNTDHLYESDVTYQKSDNSFETVHCQKQLRVGPDAASSLQNIALDFYDDAALTLLLPLKDQPTEGQDLPTQAKGEDIYIKVSLTDNQGKAVNTGVDLSLTHKNQSTPSLAVVGGQTDNGVYSTKFDTAINAAGRYTVQASATAGSTKSVSEKVFVELPQPTVCASPLTSFTVNLFRDSAHVTPASSFFLGATVYYEVHANSALGELAQLDQLTVKIMDPSRIVVDTQSPTVPVGMPFSGNFVTHAADTPGAWKIEVTGTCTDLGTQTNETESSIEPTPCNSGEERCPDGVCRAVDNCGCQAGQGRCPDGTCSASCPPTKTCASGQVLCGDLLTCGTICADTVCREANTNCGCSYGQERCSDSTCRTLGTCPTSSCPSGQEFCSDNVCRQANTNCGCGTGLSRCLDGSCRTTGTCPTGACPGGQSFCQDNVCRTTGTNCGCGAGLSRCVDGVCRATGTCPLGSCPAGQEFCQDNVCRTSNSNCGCGAGLSRCVDGVCRAIGTCPSSGTCPAGQERCQDNVCRAVSTNCGCSANQERCSNGACLAVGTCPVSCSSGQTLCPNGVCGEVCPDSVCRAAGTNCGCPQGAEMCADGACRSRCPPPWACEEPNLVRCPDGICGELCADGTCVAKGTCPPGPCPSYGQRYQDAKCRDPDNGDCSAPKVRCYDGICRVPCADGTCSVTGNCSNNCSPGQARCVNGACGIVCPDNTCQSPGSCGSCPPPQVSCNGRCASTCPPTSCPSGEILCGDGITCGVICADNTCKPAGTCNAVGPCQPGETQCADGTCGELCPDNVCRPTGTCPSINDCPPGTALCADGRTCGVICSDGTCRVPGSCPSNSCPSGQVLCQSGSCGIVCPDNVCRTPNANCGCSAGQVRCADGVCRATGTCPGGGPCSAGQTQCADGSCGVICSDGSCRATCLPYTPCPLGETLCGNGSCGIICTDNTCRPAGTCPLCPNGQEFCKDHVCRTPNTNCGCGSGQERCSDGVCRTLGTCQASCLPGQTLCANGTCGVVCPDNVCRAPNANCGCATGQERCLDGTCQPTGACPCPTGQTRCLDGVCRSTCLPCSPYQELCNDNVCYPTNANCGCGSGQERCKDGTCLAIGTCPGSCPLGQTLCPDNVCRTTGTCPPICPTGQVPCSNGSCGVICPDNLCRAANTNCGCSSGQERCSDGTCMATGTCPTGGPCPTGLTLCSDGTTCGELCPDNVCRPVGLHCGCPEGENMCPDGTCSTGCPPVFSSCFEHYWNAKDLSWTASISSNKKTLENYKTENLCGNSISVAEENLSWFNPNPGSEKLTKIKQNNVQYWSGSIGSGVYAVLSGSGFALSGNTLYSHPDALTWNQKIVDVPTNARCFQVLYKGSLGGGLTKYVTREKCFNVAATPPSTVNVTLFKDSTSALETDIEAATLSNAYDYATSPAFTALDLDYYTDAAGLAYPIKDYIYKKPKAPDTTSGSQTVNRCTTVEDNVFAKVEARDSLGELVPVDSVAITVKNPDGVVIQTISRSGASVSDGLTQAVIDFGDYDYAKNYETTDYPVTFGSADPPTDSRWTYNGGSQDTIIKAVKPADNSANNDGQWIFDSALRNHAYGTIVYTTSQTKYTGFLDGTNKTVNHSLHTATPDKLIAGDYTVEVSATVGQTTVTTTKTFKLTHGGDPKFVRDCATFVEPIELKPYFLIEYFYPGAGGQCDYLGTPVLAFNEGDKVCFKVTVRDNSVNPSGKLTLSEPFIKLVGGGSATSGKNWLTEPRQCASVSGENWAGESKAVPSAPTGVTNAYFTTQNREYYGISQADGAWQWSRTLQSGVYLDNVRSQVTVNNNASPYSTITGWFQIPKPTVVEYGAYETYSVQNVGSGKMCSDSAAPTLYRQPIASNYLLIKDDNASSPYPGYAANPPSTYESTCSRQLLLHNPLNDPMSAQQRIVDSCAGTYYPLISVKVQPTGTTTVPIQRVVNDSIKTQGSGNYFYASTWDKQAECLNIEWVGAKSLKFGKAPSCIRNESPCPQGEWINSKQDMVRLRHWAIYNKRWPKVAYGAGSSMNCVNSSVAINGMTPHLSGDGTTYGGIAGIRIWKKWVYRSFKHFRRPSYVTLPPDPNDETCSEYYDPEDEDCSDEETDETNNDCGINSFAGEEWTCAPDTDAPTAAPLAKDGVTYGIGPFSLASLVLHNGTSVEDTCSLRNAILLKIKTTGSPNAKSLELNLDSIDFRFADNSVYQSRPVPQRNGAAHTESCGATTPGNADSWPCWYNFLNASGDPVRNSNFCRDTAQHARRK
ncbi:MAG: hypothetical protein J4203_02890 [Candidatus Diapherotrites archaeon]|uniref:Uncharacterized protein n=1 Tax=Candidatus Iainarchaeum sp. TaxID=3101447 RepID=A0A8T4L842_9ARCH|nr:hypothetical protein [Candidatus Diapherotrites archaeon]